MNKFDKIYSDILESIYSSTALNEYSDTEEPDPEEEALNAAKTAASVPDEQKTSDQKNLAKAAGKFNRAATKKLSKSQSALK